MKRSHTAHKQRPATKGTSQRAVGLNLAGLPNLDAVFIAGRYLSPTHVCSDLCNALFHTDIGDQTQWADLAPAAGQLYQQYGLPYEPTHAGQFVAVVANKQTVVADTLRDVVIKAIEACPNESFVMAGFYIFRIGQRSIGFDGP